MALTVDQFEQMKNVLLDVLPSTTAEERIPAWLYTRAFSPNTRFPQTLDVSSVQYFYALAGANFLTKCVSTQQSVQLTGAGVATFIGNADGSPLIFEIVVDVATPSTDPQAAIRVQVDIYSLAADPVPIRTAYFEADFNGNSPNNRDLLRYRLHDQLTDIETAGGMKSQAQQIYPPQPLFLSADASTSAATVFEVAEKIEVTITTTNAAMQSFVRLVSPYDSFGRIALEDLGTQLIDQLGTNPDLYADN